MAAVIRQTKRRFMESRIFIHNHLIELLHSKHTRQFVRSSRTMVFSWDLDMALVMAVSREKLQKLMMKEGLMKKTKTFMLKKS